MKKRTLELSLAAAALLAVAPVAVSVNNRAQHPNQTKTTATQVRKNNSGRATVRANRSAKKPQGKVDYFNKGKLSVFSDVDKGNLHLTDKTLDNGTTHTIQYATNAFGNTWYALGNNQFVNSNFMKVSSPVPFRKTVVPARAVNTESHLDHYGILTITGDTQLLDANGKFSGQHVKNGQSYKFYATKTINGQTMIRIGNQKQWVPIAFTNMNQKDKKLAIRKGIQKGYQAEQNIKKIQEQKKHSIPRVKLDDNHNMNRVNNTNSQVTDQGKVVIDQSQQSNNQQAQNSSSSVNNSQSNDGINASNGSHIPAVPSNNGQQQNSQNSGAQNATTPAQPTDNNQSGQTPSQPTNPGQGQQENQGQSTTPAKPDTGDKGTDTPVNPSKPSDSGKTDSQGTTVPTTPTDNNKGSQGTDTPAQPSNPNKDDNKGTDQPVTPEKPDQGKTDQPTTPAKPDTGNKGTDTPVNPSKPSDSGKTENSGTTIPTTPTDNNKGNQGTDTSVQPSDPNKDNNKDTDQPVTPEKPDQGKTDQPTTPAKPDTGNKGTDTPVNPSKPSDSGKTENSGTTTPTTPTDNKGNQGTDTPVQPSDPNKDNNKDTDQLVTPEKPDQGKTDQPTTPAKPTQPDHKHGTDDSTVNIEYVDDNGNIIKTVSVSGVVGQKVTTNLSIPDDYELTDGSTLPSSVILNDKNEPIKLHVTLKSTNIEFDFVDDKNQVVGTKTLTGKIGSTITLNNNVLPLPDTTVYKLANSDSMPAVATFGRENGKQTIQLDRRSYNYTINYVDEDGNDIKSASQLLTGKVGDTVNFTPVIPEGYNETDKNEVPSVLTFSNKNQILTVHLTGVKDTLTFTFLDNGQVVGTKVFTGKPNTTINIDNSIVPEGYTLAIDSILQPSYTFTKKQENINLNVESLRDLGTITATIDDNYNVHLTMNGKGMFFYKFDGDNEAHYISYSDDASNNASQDLWNRDANFKDHNGQKVTFYVSPVSDFSGKSMYNAVTVQIPALPTHESAFTNVQLVKNTNTTDPNAYTLTVTVNKTIHNPEVEDADNPNNAAFFVNKDANGNWINEYTKGMTLTKNVSMFINQHVKTLKLIDTDDGNDAITITLPDKVYSENTYVTPYSESELLQAEQNPESMPSNIVQETAQGWAYNQYHTEKQSDETTMVDPNNLTADQQQELSEFTNRIINDARRSAFEKDGKSEDYIQRNMGKVTDRVQKLANDIANRYRNDGITIAQSFDTANEMWFNPVTQQQEYTNGHYVKGIMEAAKANGLNVSGNSIEDLASFQPVYDVMNYHTGDKVSMDEMKRGIYRNISQMIEGGRVDDGTWNNTNNGGNRQAYVEFGHAYDLLLHRQGDEQAISFETAEQDGTEYIRTHIINVTDQTKQMSATTSNWWTGSNEWLPDSGYTPEDDWER